MKLNTKTILWIALTAIILCSVDVVAENIINPVECYNITGVDKLSGIRDTSLRGQIFFDQLPEYQKKTRIVLSYNASLDTESGLVFKYSSQRFDGSLSVSEYVKSVPGPIRAGETVQTEIFITPQKIGVFAIKFSVFEEDYFENMAADDRKRQNPYSVLRAYFLIGPNGKTSLLGAKGISSDKATLLGPYPELWDKGIMFFVDPKLIRQEFDSGIDIIYDKNDVHHNNFDVKAMVTPILDSNYIRIDLRVSPYFNYTKGMTFFCKHSENVNILSLPSTINQPLDSNHIYEFTIKINIPKPGLSYVSLGICTPNPEFESHREYGLKGTDKFLTQLSLALGVDNSGEILFISDLKSLNRLQTSLGKRNGSYLDLDRRHNIIDGFENPRSFKQTYSEGYDELIREKKINNNQRIRNR